jgi:site-specific DNA recombinase
MVKAGEIDGIVIYKLDRLGRSTSDLLEIAKLMDKKGVAIHSLTEKLDTTSAVGRFFFILTSGLAEMERGLISERTIAALAQMRSNNERTNFKAPFGYEFTVDNKVVENAREQAILIRVRALKAQGESIRKIQKILTAEGLLNRNQKPFAVSAIHYMVAA